jgi:cobalamin-dependent methionine synthase I
VYHRLEAEHDVYNIIMVKALADRLAEVQAFIFSIMPAGCSL